MKPVHSAKFVFALQSRNCELVHLMANYKAVQQ
jgi:hypothetical protein